MNRPNKAVSHIRVYAEERLVIAMDTDIDGNKLANDIFNLINSYNMG